MARKAYEIHLRRLSELRRYQGNDIGEDSPLRLEPSREAAFQQNPYRWDDDPIIQAIGFVDGEVAGWDYIFPVAAKLDGKTYKAVSGSSLNVKPFARRSGLGLALPSAGFDKAAKDGLIIAAAISQMGIPIHEFNDYNFFFMPRYIALWKSRPIVSAKLKGCFASFVSAVLDVGLAFYANALKFMCLFALKGCEVREVHADDEAALEAIAGIVAGDEHRFSELHDVRWFKWHLGCSFSAESRCRLHVIEREGRIVAFLMTKTRFYESASHRGFKNVRLGSINEWGCQTGYDKLLKWTIAKVALKLREEGCDACEFATADEKMAKAVRRMGWLHVGDTNAAVKILPNFPEKSITQAMCDPANWRLRPAMGDNGLT